MTLVTLEMAKDHLKVDGSDQDADISVKVDQAEAIILDYLSDHPDVDDWGAGSPPADTPKLVQAAVLLMTGHLYERRGDTGGGTIEGGEGSEDIWCAIDLLLARMRNPVFA